MALEHPKGKDLSSRQIADLVSVSPTMVNKYRPKDGTANGGQSRNRKGRDGRVINTVNIGKGKKGKAGPCGKPAAKASHKITGAEAKQAEQPAEATATAGADGTTEVVLHGPPVEVYRRVLESLPDAFDELAKHVNDIAGKAMEPKAARKALVRMLQSIKSLYDAEPKPVRKSPQCC